MKHLLEKDRKRRASFKAGEVKRQYLKSLKKNEFLPLSVRMLAAEDLEKSGLFVPRIHNFCVASGRSRGIIRDFKVSRMVFKRLASSGKLLGVRKSSW